MSLDGMTQKWIQHQLGSEEKKPFEEITLETIFEKSKITLK